MDEITALVGDDSTQWLAAEFAEPATFYLPSLLARIDNGEDVRRRAHSDDYFEAMVEADDQLRQRMVFALSQILVVSENQFGTPLELVGYYMDILSENALGNYRDLLEDVTYSPAMARYLTYLNNRKGNPATGRMPDENYARELLQLFTIGVVELNMDGTPRTDGQGRPIETYTNEDIVGLARVFTGLSLKGPQFGSGGDDDANFSPLQIFPEQHSELDKIFLGLTIPAGTGAEQSIDMALDHIFDHPNVPPFVARQLIQRFTMSNPPPDYVERVATAFADGRYVAADDRQFGNGQRGDLQATLAAILLDESLGTMAVENGKIREPILRFAHWARAFETGNVDAGNEIRLRITSNPITSLGQHPFRAPSVFNFYRPGFVAPGTESGAAGLTAPELQIINEASTVGYLNVMARFILDRSERSDPDFNSYIPDYADEIALADDPAALVDRLSLLLTAGQMSDGTRTDIIDAISAMPLRTGADETGDREARVHAAVFMTIASPAYSVIF